jgi:Na+-transporting methylmalonyl-CoA/oxaloacetate decarboxylase gamma subunit
MRNRLGMMLCLVLLVLLVSACGGLEATPTPRATALPSATPTRAPVVTEVTAVATAESTDDADAPMAEGTEEVSITDPMMVVPTLAP